MLVWFLAQPVLMCGMLLASLILAVEIGRQLGWGSPSPRLCWQGMAWRPRRIGPGCI